jgi:hypothetical protein
MVAMCVGGVLLVADLIFGVRDSWVSARGANGSLAGGLVIGLFMLIPIASIVLCVTISRRQGRVLTSTFMRAGVVAIAVGFPVALVLVVGAAY